MKREIVQILSTNWILEWASERSSPVACISRNRKKGHQQRIKVREKGLGFKVTIQGEGRE